MINEEKAAETVTSAAEKKEPVTTAQQPKSTPKKAPKKPAPVVDEKKVDAPPSKKADASAAPKDPDFRTLKTVDELVAAYNDMVPTAVDFDLKKVNTVKTFVDVKTGVLACERLHLQIKNARAPKAAQSEAKKEKTMTTKSKKSAKKSARTSVKGATSKFKPDSKIVVAAGTENPCRKGTGRYDRVQKVLKSGGKAVGKAGIKGGTLAWCVANIKGVRVA